MDIFKVLSKPRPRSGVYELYWRFASRRQAAFERRLAGKNAPWSDDPILQEFKFCNVYRAADRVSQYMIREVCYAEEAGSPADRAFQIVAFRTFSKISTWNKLIALLGRPPQVRDLADGSFVAALDRIKREDGGLYTGAFILCATKAFGHDEKHHNHAALFEKMFVQDAIADRLIGANSFEGIVRTLESYPLMGPFMAYQTAVDLNYSELTDFSENDYTQAGPGAVRGLAKVFEDLGDYAPSEAIHWMVDQQQAEFERLDLPFSGLFGRPLHAIDCQGLFCETDKYCREAAPELASNRSRIKARYRPSTTSLELFFPPKWQLEPPARTIPAAVQTQPDLFSHA
jgi:hypothetical protein